MEHFPYIKDCLKKLKYPNIHAMDSEEIADIFSNDNRQFFVAWVLKQIDDEYEEVLENSTKEDLAEIIYSMGFCTNKQKLHFINSECDSETQIKIFYKMFKNMDTLSAAQNVDEKKPFPLTELQNLLEFDTNLFQASGHSKTLNSVQRAKKITEYLKEIEYLKTLTTSKEVKSAPMVDPELKNKLLCAMNIFESNIENFKRNASDLMENINSEGNSVEFKENFTEILEMSNEEAEIVLNFIENMNVVLNFKEHQIKDLNSDNKSRRILRDVHGLCKDVVSASKQIN